MVKPPPRRKRPLSHYERIHSIFCQLDDAIWDFLYEFTPQVDISEETNNLIDEWRRGLVREWAGLFEILVNSKLSDKLCDIAASAMPKKT